MIGNASTDRLIDQVIMVVTILTDVDFVLDTNNYLVRIKIWREKGIYYVTILYPSPQFPFWYHHLHRQFEALTKEDLIWMINHKSERNDITR